MSTNTCGRVQDGSEQYEPAQVLGAVLRDAVERRDVAHVRSLREAGARVPDGLYMHAITEHLEEEKQQPAGASDPRVGPPYSTALEEIVDLLGRTPLEKPQVSN